MDRMVTTLPTPALRAVDGHKGDFGRVLVVAGSVGLSGAACLAGKAALRSGAGLVTVACPQSIVSIVAGFEPSYTTLPVNDAGGQLTPPANVTILRQKADVLVVGPGLGQGDGVSAVIDELLLGWSGPMVVDADGLNHLAPNSDRLIERQEKQLGPVILTPHPGEMSRLAGLTIDQVQTHRLRVAEEQARRVGGVVVLKGHGTIVTDGTHSFVNPTGNPGLATGGTGDVLAGMIGGLLGQGMTPLDAARLAVYVHGRAGDRWVQQRAMLALVASDLLDELPFAFKDVLDAQGSLRG